MRYFESSPPRWAKIIRKMTDLSPQEAVTVILRSGVTTTVEVLRTSLAQEVSAHSRKKLQCASPSKLLSTLRARHFSQIEEFRDKTDQDASRVCATCSETFFDPTESAVRCPFCGQSSIDSGAADAPALDEAVRNCRRAQDLVEVLDSRHSEFRASRWSLAVALYSVRALEKWKEFGYGSFTAYLQDYYARTDQDARSVSVSTAEQLSRLPEMFSREHFLEHGHKKLITIVNVPELVEEISGRSASEVREMIEERSRPTAATSSSTSNSASEPGAPESKTSPKKAAATRLEDPVFHALHVKLPRAPWSLPLLDRRTGKVITHRSRSSSPPLDQVYFDLPLQGTDLVLQGSLMTDAAGKPSGIALEVREFEQGDAE